jgi:glycyl-tRNA synthetase beta chain
VSRKDKSRKLKVEGPTKTAGSTKAREASASREKTLPLLVEIGCEEIPARFLTPAQTDFGNALVNALGEARLLPEGLGAGSLFETYSTPRRLVALVPHVLEKQTAQVEEVLGPPLRVAFDAEGKPTKAAESFAQKNWVGVKDLARVSTPKGEYLALRKTTKGLPASQILSELLARVILSLSFPKSMYWVAKAGPRFVRPIRWLLALLGEGKQARVIPFEVAGVTSSSLTFGHRTAAKGPVRVKSFKEYSTKLRQLKVEIHPERRRERVRAECKALLEHTKWRVVPDPNLEDWIVNSTEWPKGLVGGFEERFLELPREILITVMRDHQKYFAVEDRAGKLQPLFLTVLNVDGDPKGLIRAGHERVLAARFSDAEFFWKADQRMPLRDRQAALEGVTYQAQLGSYAEKVKRMVGIAGAILSTPQDGDPSKAGLLSSSDVPLAYRALQLCKCDLTTQMVFEFPELQGIVGGLYARAQGESPAVAEAIYDHYLPQSMEDPCPRSVIGAVVSLADKLDSVVSGFAVGLEPTGSSDPFALRRAGNGVVKVLVELSLPLPLRSLVEKAVLQVNVDWNRPQMEVFSSLTNFFADRLRYYLESARGFRFDTVRAVMTAGWDVPADAARRAEALEKIRDSEDFEALSAAAKRIKNILAKSASAADWRPGEVDAEALEAGEEKALHEAFTEVQESADRFRQAGEYEKALKAIARLRQPVDRFFDKVLVMAQDPALRSNRLRLVGKLDELFSGVAHFAEIAPAPQNVGASTKVKVTSEK